MKRAMLVSGIFFVLGGIAATTPAQGQSFSPPKGQTSEVQNSDRAQCHAIAVKQSGFDPTQPQAVPAPPPARAGGERARGAARGAAVGATAGAIGGDAGKGAAAGAAAGTVVGGSRKRQARRQQEAQAQQQQAAMAQGQDGYRKALAACMQSKGYTIQ